MFAAAVVRLRRAALLAWLVPGVAGATTLAEYLAQVEAGNPALSAARAAERAAPARAGEVDLQYTPLLTGSFNWMDDRQEPATSFAPDRTLATQWNVGLAKRWSTGTALALGYGASYARLFLAPLPPGLFLPPALTAGFLPAPAWTARPSVTVSQSLWKDLVARGAQAGSDKVRAQAAAGAALQEFQVRGIRVAAEAAYWSVALARRMVAEKEATLDRTRKMETWADRRVRLNLADEADLLQVRGAVALRALDLRTARQDLASAVWTFSEMRGVCADSVTELLDDPEDAAAALPGQAPGLPGERPDMTAAGELARAARLARSEAVARAGPDVTVFGTAALNGRDPLAGEANREAWGGDRPTWLAGAALVVPLGIPAARRVLRGYDDDLAAANAGLARAVLEVSHDWRDLAGRWEDAAERFALAGGLVRAQAAKLEREAERYSAGRTLMLQVLAFEEDVAMARTLRLHTAFERLMLAARARLWGAAP